MDHRVEWRGSFDNRALNELHAEAFEHPVFDDDWAGQVERHSLGWVCAWDTEGELVGFVNLPWDGAFHAFVIDTIVSRSAARQGLGTAMVTLAAEHARGRVRLAPRRLRGSPEAVLLRRVRLRADERRPDQPQGAVKSRSSAISLAASSVAEPRSLR